MIVNLKDSTRFNPFRFVFSSAHVFYIGWRTRVEAGKINQDSLKLKKHFTHKYPTLKNDQLGNSLCISCEICSEICPTKAIEIKKPNMVNFPNTLKTGETPQKFYLDTSHCTRCNLCAIACPTDAIELTGDYSQLIRVNLVERAMS
ncbi:MAG: 4Fe-4S binding protein [Bdellovibrionota bacterium]|nr:4Fe-4S binding protein [Bdellovibrionota bacterium]